MKTQVIFIHGGDTFETYDQYIVFLKTVAVDLLDLIKRKWSRKLQEKLGDEYNVVSLEMPCKWNAKYSEWKLWFEKHIPLLDEEVVFVGHSLGGIFLAKYFSENSYPKKIKGMFVIAAPFDDKDSEYSLADFILQDDLSKLAEQTPELHFYQSKDDPVVPFADLNKYKNKLSAATFHVFDDRGHFNQEEFPEIIEHIKALG